MPKSGRSAAATWSRARRSRFHASWNWPGISGCARNVPGLIGTRCGLPLSATPIPLLLDNTNVVVLMGVRREGPEGGCSKDLEQARRGETGNHAAAADQSRHGVRLFLATSCGSRSAAISRIMLLHKGGLPRNDTGPLQRRRAGSALPHPAVVHAVELFDLSRQL